MVKISDSRNSSSAIYIYIYRCALTFFLLLLSPVILFSHSAFASDLDYNVTVKPSLKLTVSSNNLVLNLNPANHTFDSIDLNTNVATNNTNGYKLYVSTNDLDGDDNPDTDLVNTINSTYKIPNLPSTESGYDTTTFPTNYWGYKLGTTNFFPFESGALVSQSATYTNGTVSTVTFGAKIDYEKPAGQYNIALNFQALPAMSNYYMQDFATDPTLKDTICTETPTMVMDKRDGHTYAIAKLKDGKCWMVQNLRLGENLESTTGSMTLTSDDTNISSTDTYNPESQFVLTNKVENGYMPSKPFDGGYIWDASAFYCTSDYGCYYNFYTASAGIRAESEEGVVSDTRVVATQDTDITTDVCPKGWALPTGGTTTQSHASDFRTMVNNYGYGLDSASTVAARLLVNPTSATENINGSNMPGFLLAGDYYDGGASNVNVYGSYWSRTVFSATHSYLLGISSTAVYPTDHYSRRNGRPVRCLLQE